MSLLLADNPRIKLDASIIGSNIIAIVPPIKLPIIPELVAKPKITISMFNEMIAVGIIQSFFIIKSNKKLKKYPLVFINF